MPYHFAKKKKKKKPRRFDFFIFESEAVGRVAAISEQIISSPNDLKLKKNKSSEVITFWLSTTIPHRRF